MEKEIDSGVQLSTVQDPSLPTCMVSSVKGLDMKEEKEKENSQ